MKYVSKKVLIGLLILALFASQNANSQSEQVLESSHEDLVSFFKEWRTFEKPPLLDGAPDYRKETFENRQPKFIELQKRFKAIDTAGWETKNKVDWHLVKAEMNGYDFNNKVLKPWVRDPAFYTSLWMSRSDVPAHEGPTHHGTTELWQYHFPLSKEKRVQFLVDLAVIPALNEQAKQNLTGNAKELWWAGIRNIESQSRELKTILDLDGIAKDKKIIKAVERAIASTDDLAAWLKMEGKTKTGASGIGKENYTWYLQNVHLVPLTWEDEVMILKRELARAWASLKLEEHRNRNLPELTDADSPEAYDKRADEAAKSLIRFLKENDIVTVKDYFEPALREHLGGFVPANKRNFFWITAHYDQRPLYSHFYHWFELARMDIEPNASAIRKGPLLYNIFDSRNEGTATAVEETFMQAGLYDDNPRVREIVYIMIAQRAARGLGSLYAHANELTMEEAGSIHSEYTPRGWMKTEKELLLFEQHLYMRQPGYGSSYITGKYLMEIAMMDFAKMKEVQNEPFKIGDFFDQLNAIGNIPISLGHWQMTGKSEHLEYLKSE